jgi:hypothetical protein
MSRLLLVGYLMDRSAARLEDVASQLGFDSADAIRLKLSRLSGCTASQLTRAGWLATLKPMIHMSDSDSKPVKRR